MHKHITTLIACLALATTARAQLLDFGSGAPEPGTGANTLALAFALTNDADQLEAKSDDTSAAAAKIAIRRLAAAMLTQGEHAGPKGSTRIVAARRIATRLTQIDEALDLLQIADPAAAEMIRAQAKLAETNIPEPDHALDRMLRNVFAPLNPTGRPPAQVGWSPGPAANQPDLQSDIETWEREATLSAAALDALRSLDARLTSLQRWSAYHDSIARFRLQVREAALCLTLDPKWIGQEAADALIARFEAALIDAADPAKSDLALNKLRTVTLLTALTPAVQSLVSGSWARPSRDALAETIKGRGWNPNDELRSIELLAKSVKQLQDGDRYDDDSTVIRQLRPAWRVFAKEQSKLQAGVIRAFPAMLASPNAETNPAVLAALGAHANTIEELALLTKVSTVMTQPLSLPPGTSPGLPRPTPIPINPSPTPISPNSPTSRQPVASATWQRPANAFLKLGQDMSRPATADEAQLQFHALAQDVVAFVTLPGEESLDARERGWAPMLQGSSAVDLASAIDAARLQWVLALGRGGPDVDSARLATLHDLMKLLNAVRTVRELERNRSTPRMNAWPGWSLSSPALAGMLAEPARNTSQLAALAMRSSPDVAQDAIAQALQDAAPIMLIAQIESLAEQSGLGPEPINAAAAIWSLTTGPPRENDTFLISLRSSLAQVCRYGQEGYAPPPSADTNQRANAKKARTYCNEIAAQALDQLNSH